MCAYCEVDVDRGGITKVGDMMKLKKCQHSLLHRGTYISGPENLPNCPFAGGYIFDRSVCVCVRTKAFFERFDVDFNCFSVALKLVHIATPDTTKLSCCVASASAV